MCGIQDSRGHRSGGGPSELCVLHKGGEKLGIVGESGSGKSVSSGNDAADSQPPGQITGGEILYLEGIW